MNFFEAQDAARRSTLWLVLLFSLAVAGLILLTNLLVLLVIAYKQTGQVLTSKEALTAHFQWDVFLAVAFVVGTLVFLGSLYKMMQLMGGGRIVAEALGGQRIPAGSDDPQHRKVLNVVEEMAIASGTPVPVVYLLNEAGINAFAAGWTPNDAVIGLTQGAVIHLGMIGYYLMRLLRYARSSRNEKGGSIILALFGLGLGLMVIGYVGTFFGQWIKAMVSRQREYLADASAVQFTRNPEGIAEALKKIGGLHAGSLLLSPAAPLPKQSV